MIQKKYSKFYFANQHFSYSFSNVKISKLQFLSGPTNVYHVLNIINLDTKHPEKNSFIANDFQDDNANHYTIIIALRIIPIHLQNQIHVNIDCRKMFLGVDTDA